MDLGHLLGGPFLLGLVNIMFINIILSGDNAVVIAMAVRTLPAKERQWGIVLGTAGAVILRIGLTFAAARLLDISGIKLAGGILILWIAFKLLIPEYDDDHGKEVRGLRQAIVTILTADLVMSLDNVLGVAGAAQGDTLLLFIGLATSIPIVVLASNVITSLMTRFPVIVLLGAAVLGRVAGEMIMTDPLLVRAMGGHGSVFNYTVQIILAVGVVAAAKMWVRFRAPRVAPALQFAAEDGEEGGKGL